MTISITNLVAEFTSWTNVQVRGTVLVNGNPAVDAVVNFAGGFSGTAETDQNGLFICNGSESQITDVAVQAVYQGNQYSQMYSVTPTAPDCTWSNAGVTFVSYSQGSGLPFPDGTYQYSASGNLNVPWALPNCNTKVLMGCYSMSGVWHQWGAMNWTPNCSGTSPHWTGTLSSPQDMGNPIAPPLYCCFSFTDPLGREIESVISWPAATNSGGE